MADNQMNVDRQRPYEETRDGFILGFNVVREISEATDLLSPLKATCLLMVRGLEITKKINHNKKLWRLITKKLEQQLHNLEKYQEIVQDPLKQSHLEPLKALASYSEVLKEVLSHAVKAEGPSKSLWKRVIRASLDEEDIIDWTDRIEEAYKTFQEAMQITLLKQTLHTKQVVNEMKDDVKILVQKEEGPEHKNLESSQDIAYGVRLDLCQEGTRVNILEKIRKWANEDIADQQIFWLNDVAGSGKSTIAATMAYEWIEQKRLGGRFFFTPNSRSTSGLAEFCETVGKDISTHHPGVRSLVQKAIQETTGPFFRFEQRFQRLVIEPLRACNRSVILVVDGLDNCDPSGYRLLIQQLMKQLPSIPRVKAFITSRPLATIVSLLGGSSIVAGNDVQIYKASGDTNDPDIRLYVKMNIKLQHLTDNEREQLVRQSNGLFIWIATVSRLCENSREIKKLLSQLLYLKDARNLDWLYLECLKRALIDVNAHESFMNVLQVVIIAEEPVSISMVQVFLPNNRSVHVFINDLGSIIKDGDTHRPLWVLHPTFRDFVSQSERSNGFLIEPNVAHNLMANACLQCLLQLLHFDLVSSHRGGVHFPSENGVFFRNLDWNLQHHHLDIDKGRFDALVYAVKHWTHHLSRCMVHEENFDALYQFLREKLLNWMELLSLLRMVRQGIEDMHRLYRTLKILNRPTSQKLDDSEKLCQDAAAFLQAHQSIISQAALHVYRSALPFTPKSTHIYQTYKALNEHHMPQVLSGVPPRWKDYKMLKGHASEVRRICFSPDGCRFASGSRNGCLVLWDSITGAMIGRHSRIPAAHIDLITFTPDGRIIVTDSSDHEALVWDGETGRFLDIELTGHKARITALAISPDGQYLVTGSKDCSIIMWSLKTFKALGEPLRGHNYQIEHLDISPNGQLMASAARGECIIWKTTTRVVHKLTQSCHTRVTAMSFNPQSTGLLTCGNDGTVAYTLMNLDQSESASLGSHTSWVTCCVISMDGTWAASCDESGSIYFWDLSSFSLKSRSPKYTGYILSKMVIHKDQRQLIITTDNEVLMLYDVISGKITTGPFQGENGMASTSAISPDQAHVAIGNVNGGISFWNLPSLEHVGVSPHEIRESSIAELRLSPDRKIIATSATNYNAVHLWDASTGESIGDSLSGHSSPISCIGFSHDSCLLAGGSQDGTIRVWKIEDGDLYCSPIHAHKDKVTTLDFSFDNIRFVSGSMDSTLSVWDTRSGEQVYGPFRDHSSMIVVAIYMRTGTILSTSTDGTTLLRDLSAANHNPSVRAIKHFGRINDRNVIVSHDESYLVCASADNTLEVWRLQPRLEHVANHLRWVFVNRGHFYFSEDDRYVWYEDELYDLQGSSRRATPFERGSTSRPLSVLEYKRGWISAIGIGQNLVEVPSSMKVRRWVAYGGYIALGIDVKRVVIADCRHLLSTSHE